MKKTFIYSISLLFLLAVGNSCKKEKMTFNPELCGTWELRQFINCIYLEDNSNYFDYFEFFSINNFDNYSYDNIKYGALVLNILPSGKFIYSYKGGTEKFQLVKQEDLNFTVYKHIPNQTKDVGYNLHLRNWKGEVFQFKFTYDVESNTITTVPWYKGTVFYKKDAPFLGFYDITILGYHYTANSIPNRELLGIFKKIQ